MPCKIMKKNCGSGASNKIKTRHACIMEASESTRLRMGESLPNHHEDHIATIWFTNLFLCLKPEKIPAGKPAVDKEWEKLEKISVWNLTNVRSKKEIDEARATGAKVHLCH